MSATDKQRYLFDLQGYLVVEDVLTADEVATLNGLIDEQGLAEPGDTTDEQRFGGGGAGDGGAGFLEWGRPFANLLDHPDIMPIVAMVLGEGFRIDHFYGIYMREGTRSSHIHGGATPFVQSEYFYFKDGSVHNGLSVVSWNLSDVGPEHGGFLCIPGSHKSNYRAPDSIIAAHENASCVVVPEAKAGSAIVFTEALSHGTAPWTAEHQRRSLLYKYDPSHLAYSAKQAEPPKSVDLTDRQKLLFEPPSNPGSFGRKSLFEPELAPKR